MLSVCMFYCSWAALLFFFSTKDSWIISQCDETTCSAESKVNKELVNRQESCYTSAVSPPPDPGLLKLGSALCGWWFDCSVIKAFLTTRRSSILACHLFLSVYFIHFCDECFVKVCFVWVCLGSWVTFAKYLICWVSKMCLSKEEETENKLLARSLGLFFSVRPHYDTEISQIIEFVTKVHWSFMTGVTRLFKQVQVDRFYPVMLSPLNTQDEMNEVLTALILNAVHPTQRRHDQTLK